VSETLTAFDLLQSKMRERTVVFGVTRELVLSLREGEPTLVSRAGPGGGGPASGCIVQKLA
jgi:hypothetical protein